MIPFPKPRGFWDYSLFALFMTGLLMLLFLIEASDGIGWTDAAFAGAAAALLVFAIIFARRAEKAKWIVQPTWYARALTALGVFIFILGALYGDAYLLHRNNLIRMSLRHDVVLGIVLIAWFVWSPLRRFRAKPQAL
ncbi:MAG TPA: hypothetical protein VJW20_14395 [Candidatus Angelobacter sp.]|nr:hypothetical protein [Candidatus Angelobacter sp.]